MTLVTEVVSGPLLLAVPLAVLAGTVSFASPCVLPLVPGYLAYVGGTTDVTTGALGTRGRTLFGVVLFVLGFAIVFVLFGIAFGAAGFWLIQWREVITRATGLVVAGLGLLFIGRLRPLQRTLRLPWSPVAGLAGAPILGAVLALGWTPCIGPTLAAILSLSLDGASPWRGAILGLAYALGLGVPFVLIALGIRGAAASVRYLRRHLRAVNLAGGGLLVGIGVLMMSGLWSDWMLQLGAMISGFTPVV